MFELSIKGEIMAAHFLREYKGKCKNLHGHTWKIEVTVKGGKLNSLGMVADFSVLKEKLNDLLMGLDHICLNDIKYFAQKNPTTENIAKYIYDAYAGVIAPLQLLKVRVWESDNASVTYYKS